MSGSISKQPITVASRGFIACIGLALALMGATPAMYTNSSPGNAVVARVNQQAISLQSANGIAQGFWGVSYDQLSDQQQQSAIQVLVDQELLLQRAESLSITSTDPGLRKAMAAAMIDQFNIEFLSQPVTDSKLQQFYQSYSSIFEQPSRVAIDGLRLTSKGQIDQAKAMIKSGSDLRSIASRLQHSPLLPRGLLPVHMVHRHLGPSLATATQNLKEGEISAPLQRPDGLYFLQVTQIQPAYIPDYQTIGPAVEAEYKRRGRDSAVQAQLQQLWQQASIRVTGR